VPIAGRRQAPLGCALANSISLISRQLQSLVSIRGAIKRLIGKRLFRHLKVRNRLKTKHIWWPGRELNPRRQPFQGCALPPELPGHFLSTHLFAQRLPRRFDRAAFARCACALTGAGCREAKQPMRWKRAELTNYNNPVPFPQNDCAKFLPGRVLLVVFSLVAHSSRLKIDWPPATPFMIVSAEWLVPNQ
jgi:hypothetical protein